MRLKQTPPLAQRQRSSQRRRSLLALTGSGIGAWAATTIGTFGVLALGGCQGQGAQQQGVHTGIGPKPIPAPIDAASSPLPGPIFDPASGNALSAQEWLLRLGAARQVLLGEQHDDPQHHLIRGRIVRQWVRAQPVGGPAPVIVFEHFDRRHRDALLALGLAGESAPTDLEAWLDAGGFDRQGWRWPLHRPLFEAAQEAALKNGVRWIAANLSRDEARALRQTPPDAALERVIAQSDWSGRAQAQLEAEIREGHCNMLPPAAVPGMVRVQRLRDAILASALREAPAGALLLAGNGHVRRDHGVPRYLGAGRGSGLESTLESTLVAGFIERADRPEPGASMVPDAALARLYDLVCITPPVEREDPCAAFVVPRSGPS